MSSGQGVFIIHHIPGRMRLGVEALRGDPERAERVADLARRSPWVEDARANPRAGCLTVEHDPEVPLERVLPGLGRIPELSDCGTRAVQELACPCPAPPAEPPSPGRTARLLLEAATQVNTAACSVTHPQVDLKLLLPGALVGYGVLRAFAVVGGPHWITLVKYGFDTFVVLNSEIVQRFMTGAADPRPASKTAP